MEIENDSVKAWIKMELNSTYEILPSSPNLLQYDCNKVQQITEVGQSILKEMQQSEVNICLPISEQDLESKTMLVRYAWGCDNSWFITKNKRCIMPKGSRLLIRLGCEKTNHPIHTKSNYPTVGDVISDVDSNVLRIINCEFY